MFKSGAKAVWFEGGSDEKNRRRARLRLRREGRFENKPPIRKNRRRDERNIGDNGNVRRNEPAAQQMQALANRAERRFVRRNFSPIAAAGIASANMDQALRRRMMRQPRPRRHEHRQQPRKRGATVKR